MDYRFIKISDSAVVLFGYRGSIRMVNKLRDGILSVGIYDLITLVSPYLDEGYTVIIYDIEENRFIRLDEEKLVIF